MSKDVFETLVISEDITTITHQIMSPYLESMDNSS
jgi:hypothetical protein